MSEHNRTEEGRERTEVYHPSSRPPLWVGKEKNELSLVELVNVVLRHRRKVLGTSVVAALLLVVGSILWPASYTVNASFMPQTGGGMSGQLSQLSGVAAQFGVDVPTGEAGQTPQFYSNLVTSRRVLRNTVTANYVVISEGDTIQGNLLEVYGLSETSDRSSSGGRTDVDALVKREKAIERLREDIGVTSNAETGVVKLSVTTGSPQLSQQIAERLIEGVNRFNLEVRQSQASEQAEFIRERLQTIRAELRTVEDSLKRFLQRNVGWQQSPELRFEHDRLQRRVSLKQQVYTSLSSRYEEARINEVRNTPVITSVTQPERPAQPDSEHIPLKAILGLVVGGMVGFAWAFGSEFSAKVKKTNQDDYREFASLKQEAVEDLRQAGRRMRRLLKGRGSGTES